MLISGAVGLGLLAGAWVLFAGHRKAEVGAERKIETLPPNVIVMSETQRAAIGLETGAVQVRRMQSHRAVPGRLQYDNRRHVEIRASLAATIAEIAVKPGDRVEAKQVLAVLSSPEVGAARADLLERTAALKLAQQQFDWEESACEGLQLLVEEIQQRSPPDEILQKLKKRRVGSDSERIVTAYSRSLLSHQQADRLQSLETSGAVSSRSVQSAVAERDTSQAELAAAVQESQFAADQRRDRAAAAVADAERRVQISREQVDSLLGYGQGELPSDGLSLVEVRAPFAGTIEAQPYSVSERVAARDVLFTLADTSQLWVAADIREAEWPALQLKEGAKLNVAAPAIPGREWTAEVYYIGREVESQTNSVPVVATISNQEGLLRPGQFVRIETPLGAAREVLAAPSSAVVQHDGQSFVFVPVSDERFERVNVVVGETIDGWTEVVSGLRAGEQVVSQGAFALKSELLLTGEE